MYMEMDHQRTSRNCSIPPQYCYWLYQVLWIPLSLESVPCVLLSFSQDFTRAPLAPR